MVDHMESRWQIPAQVEEIDRIITAANRIFDRQNLDQHDRFALNLLLWESLTNAIVHGCNGPSPETIDCRIQLLDSPSGLETIIEVTDPGSGFDWRLALTKECVSLQKDYRPENLLPESGRGLVIFMKYATSFEFNEAGNRIALHRQLKKGCVTNE
jgi:anti-sigma regulatory factor (Ser/Thr protein kinase)